MSKKEKSEHPENTNKFKTAAKIIGEIVAAASGIVTIVLGVFQLKEYISKNNSNVTELIYSTVHNTLIICSMTFL